MPDMAAGMFMRNRDSLQSGNEIIYSIQSQARYNLRIAVDAKTVGGVRRFSADNDVVVQWTMGRDDQAQHLNSLLQIWNIRQQYQPSQILKSESRTSNLAD